MTFAIISDMRDMAETHGTAVPGMLDATLPSGSPARIVEPAVDGWRGARGRTSAVVMGVLIQSAAPIVADTEDDVPTWEDAEWQ